MTSLDRTAQDALPWQSVGALLRHAAVAHGAREFLRFGGESLSFTDVDAYTNRLARVLVAHGVRRGERVAIMMDNVAGWPLSWLSVVKIGAVAVPINAAYREADLRFVLSDSAAVLVLTSGAHADLVRSVAGGVATVREVHTLDDLAAELAGTQALDLEVDVTPADLANLQYTSGTTGFPKACMLTHDYWLRTAWQIGQHSDLCSDDVFLMAQAFSYMDPQWATVMCLIGGIPLVILPRFSASGFWNSAREHGATITYVLGTMPLLLFKQPPSPLDREHRMRLALCSGIAPDLHRAFEDRWGALWREVYGSTESGLDLMVRPGEVETVGTGAMGLPPQGKEVRVVDEAGDPVPMGQTGEIVVRGRPLMLGYWNNPESTAEVFRGGWFHTGDLGYTDECGWIHHAGRLKDIIRRGGENISAAEVQEVLEQHPAVLAVAVVGVPDELFGELPHAFVQLAGGYRADTATARDIAAYARAQLAKFKVPAYLTFVDSFPMTPSARIRKSKLLEQYPDPRAGAFDTASETWNRNEEQTMTALGTESGHIDVTIRDEVAVVTLQRPECLNALTGAMRAELAALLRQYGTGETVRGIVVTGTGRAFSAGEDLNEAATAGGIAGEVESFNDITRAAMESNVPVLAAYNGLAVGGAFEMTMCFDARLATAGAEFYLPENDTGISISNAASILLPRLVGHRAMALVLGSARIDAQEALAIGLVDRIVDADDLVATAVALVQRWTQPGTATLAHLRLLRPTTAEIEEAFERETEAARHVDEAGIAQAGIQRFLTRKG